MAKIEYLEAAREFFTSSKFIKFFYLICFTLVITAIISSQNFFFQNVIENGKSKKEIIACSICYSNNFCFIEYSFVFIGHQ